MSETSFFLLLSVFIADRSHKIFDLPHDGSFLRAIPMGYNDSLYPF
jgi:hypothetical protein